MPAIRRGRRTQTSVSDELRGGDPLLSNVRSQIVAVFAVAIVGTLGLVSNAMAAADTATSTAVSGAATTLADTAQAALPIIAGVAVALVLLGFVKKLIRKAS